MSQQQDGNAETAPRVAVVGMSGRFAGARDVDELWRVLRQGATGIRRYGEEELLAAGVPRALLDDPHYVRAGAPLSDMEKFDAGFFGITPVDASIMDPQHRHFLECCWEGFERAGIDPGRFDGSVGIFAGCGYGTYLTRNLLTNPELVEQTGFFLLRHTGNDKDFFATRVSYELDLDGPSVNVQTACSTSLVAVHLACQSLLNGECDLALAGGATVELPHHQGYLHRPGEIPSPDGHCRPFDARAAGTVFGSGVGVVLLRRLDDALADGDPVLAVILGSAVANDGAGKVGFLAPSVDGQTRVISEALAVAEAEPRSIGFVECMGSGTPLGDAIEVEGLARAFRQGTEEKGFCAIGSVKPNIGHTDTAAGVAGLIKTVQALRHGEIPATLHFQTPHPDLRLDEGPFYVNAECVPWAGDGPRRAGVSSLGIGGTNAHVVLEEPPAREATGPSRPLQLLLLSGRSEGVVQRAADRLADHLRNHPELPLADVAHTLRTGRRAFAHRRALVCRDADDAVRRLEEEPPGERIAGEAPKQARPLTFLLPGAAGSPTERELFGSEPFYRARVDECLALLTPEQASQDGPARFVAEWALARLFVHWGLEPAALAGHGVGALAAACLADAIDLEQALRLIVARDGDERRALLAAAEPRPPKLSLLSGIDGSALSEEEAADPEHWLRALRAGGGAAPLDDPERALLRVDPAADLGDLLATLGRLWVAGATPDWHAFVVDEQRRRVELPSYPWEHERHWIEPGAGAALDADGPVPREDDPARWLQVLSWRRTSQPTAAPNGEVVLFGDGGDDFGARLVDALRASGRAVRAVRGEAEDLPALIESLGQPLPRDFVHLGGLAKGTEAAAADALRDFSALAALAATLGSEEPDAALRLHVVTAQLHGVGGEPPGPPHGALALGLGAVIPSEYPNLRIRHLDTWPSEAGDPDALARRLALEIGDVPDDVVALRGRSRFVPGFAPLAPPARSTAPSLREGGVYLIAGRPGELEWELARHLARRARARVALVTPEPLPPRLVEELAALGAEPLVQTADVTDEGALRGAIASVEKRFGALHGVVYAPGPCDAGLLGLASRDALERALADTVAGASSLDAALRGRELDFLWLHSSLDPWLGGAGRAAAAATGAFLAAFARERSARPDGGPTLAIGWAPRQGGPGPAEESPHGQKLEHPLLQELRATRGTTELYVSSLGAAHGVPAPRGLEPGHMLLPGAAFLEIARAALTVSGDVQAVELDGVLLLSPFWLGAGEPHELRLRFDRARGEFAIASPTSAEPDAPLAEHARGQAAPCLEPPPPARPLDALRARCAERVIEGAPAAAQLGFAVADHGLERVGIGSGEALAEFAPGASDPAQGAAHFDRATGWGHVLLPDHDPEADLLLPISYGRVVLREALPERFCAHLRLRSEGEPRPDFALFDIDLLDADGREIARVEELMFKRLKGARGLETSGPPLVDAAEFEGRSAGAAAADDRPLAIRPADALPAIDALLAGALEGDVLVAPRPLGPWLDRLAARRRADAPRAARLDPATLAELRQVEAALAEMPGVAEAALSVHFDRPGQRRLLAHVVWDREHTGTVSELRRALRDRLSEELVPQNFVELDALTRGADGGVDAEALEDPFGIADDYVAPRTPTEKALARLWRSALGVDRVGRHDNFFDVGGHSVLAMRVVLRIARELGVTLKNSSMVLQTLEQVAAECDRLRGHARPGQPDPGAPPEGGDGRRAGLAVRWLGAATRGWRERRRSAGAGERR